ncbi:hypothetical protein G6O67_000017 [Ophiocordyceps sinensis]|uniref:SMP-LTD domain-containing protein n=1 Tax=Ophiocordyceps sinensis TaxID=72228 RepID=A0A8H4PY81_9HYPO|nr:hypothetical protein G6O67_000017 [Ophiocordyceps sinensis]
MGGLTAILVAYVVGGVTFIPLVLAVIFAHGFYTLPHRHYAVAGPNNDYVEGGILLPGDDKTPLEAARKAVASEPKARANREFEVAAGYFAVCREYTPMGINAKPIERSTPMGSTTVAPTSPSVYQTMYRSIFDRKPASGAQDSNGLSQRPKKAGNVFYVVLRHGHLMLFDDEEQLEVRHVVSLAHHDISIYSGGDATPEGELFIKRNALCLSRRPEGPDQTPDSHVSKPFYLFSENCSAKEDFYFALLKNQEQTFGFDASAPKPKQFDVKNIISLVQRLHSSEDHVHSRWLNAMLGRLFLAVYKTRDLENLIRDKITSKISRVKRPSFLTNITIQGIDTGEAAPYFTNFKLKDLTVEGECVVEADVKYTGNFRIQVGATVKIDLGARFKAREVNLVLAVLLKRVEGHVLFKIKAPPSNRLWFSFQAMPKMEMAIEPIVSSRQITYTVILRQIENRIKEVFAETLVLPFWDDVPFFRTDHKRWRGGIFESDDALESPADADASADQPSDEAPATDRPDESAREANETPPPLEKSHSLPVLERQMEKTGLFGRKLAKNENHSTTSVVSSGVEAKAPSCSPLRSPSILKNSTDPIVGTETAHADLFKPSSSPPDQATNFMAALQSRSQDVLPMTSPTGSPAKARPSVKVSSQSLSKEAGDRERGDDVNANPVHPGRRNTASSAESSLYGDASNAESPMQSSPAGSLKNHSGSLGRGFFLRRETSNATTASTESANGEAKRGTLAAVTNAAAQARQWGWNAIQRQKDAKRGDERVAQVDLSQPMGRGQPLPPPGVPLPGPTNGSKRIVPVAAPQRKLTAEQPPAEVHETDKGQETRPAPPSSLPQTRRRGPSLEQMGDDDQNMLVVAAPDDSQPGTPPKERQLGDRRSWAGATAVVEEEPVSMPASINGRVRDQRSASLLDVRVTPPSPLVALPAAATVDDDDDFSGWMEDDILDEEQHGGERLPAAVVGSVH